MMKIRNIPLIIFAGTFLLSGCSIKHVQEQKILYEVEHSGSVSWADNQRLGTPIDGYSEFFTMNAEAENQEMIFTDKKEDFFMNFPGTFDRQIRKNGETIYQILLRDRRTLQDSWREIDFGSGKVSKVERETSFDDGYTVSEKEEIVPSPDGRKVAYVARRGADSEEEAAIFIKNDNGGIKKIFEKEKGSGVPFYLNWSPDSQRIVFVEYPKDWIVTRTLGTILNIINADGTGLKQLISATEKLDPGEPIWSPDGQNILTVLSKELTLINIANKKQEKIGEGYRASWSPDGKKILYLGYDDDNVNSVTFHVFDCEKKQDFMIEIPKAEKTSRIEPIGWIED